MKQQDITEREKMTLDNTTNTSGTSTTDNTPDYPQEAIDQITAIAQETKNILEWIESEGIGEEED